MRSLSRIECFTVGCTNEASTTINGEHVCTQCAELAHADQYELWDADPNCVHDEQPQSGGGVKCSKCGGWFCY